MVGQEDLLREIDRQKEFYLLQKKKRRGAVAGLKFYMIFTLNVAKGTHPLFVGNIGSDMSGSFATSP